MAWEQVLCEARLQRWLVENKRGVVVSSIVGLGLVLVVVVAVVSSQGGAVPLPGGEWGMWTPWTECEGEVARQRVRSCLRPPCSGDSRQNSNCSNVVLALGGWGRENSRESGLSSVEMVGKPNCTLPSLPFPVWGSSAFFTRDHLPLVCGGHHNESRGVFYSPTSCFQFKDRAWQNFSAKLTREEGWTHSVVLPSGTFILGGRNDSKSSEFLPVGQTLAWREGPKIPGPGAIYACTVAISDTRFAVIGGELKNRSLVFDTSSWRWTSFTLSSPIMASSPDCLLRNGQILITGGRLPDRSPSASTWKIDPSTWEVTQAADLVQGRFKHRMAELDGRVVVVGGQTNGQNFDSIEELDEVSGTWKNTGVNLKTARNGHSLLILPGTSQDYC